MMRKLILSAIIVGLVAIGVTAFADEAAVAAAPAAAKLAEDQIPLTIEAAKKPAEAGSPVTKALMSGMILLALAGTSFYFVRKYRSSNSINKSNMQIKVLSQHYLGPKKSLAIIHVAGESMLVGITDTNISMIKSLSLIDDEVPANVPNTFADSLTKADASAPTAARHELDEEFSFSNVTDTVSKKIKSMRSFS